MKIIEFKTVSPLFEMERDGIKPFTERKVDYCDPRFRALSQFESLSKLWPNMTWGIKITNPQTGESFTRVITNVAYLSILNTHTLKHDFLYQWRIISMGEIVEDSK